MIVQYGKGQYIQTSIPPNTSRLVRLVAIVAWGPLVITAMPGGGAFTGVVIVAFRGTGTVLGVVWGITPAGTCALSCRWLPT